MSDPVEPVPAEGAEVQAYALKVHGLKGKPKTKEHRRKLSAAKKGKPHGPMSEETKRKLSEAKKGKSNGRLGAKLSEATKQKMSQSAKKWALTSEYKQYISERTKNKWAEENSIFRTEEFREKQSKACRGLKRPPRSEEHRRKISENMKRITQNPEYKFKASARVAKQIQEGKWPSNRYSTHELKLEPILKKRGFKATYNHPFFIHCKDRTRLPDFVNVRTHEVIEFFGTYWHRDRVLPDGKKHETEEYVIEQYALVGWDCKIIWEYQFDEYIKGNSNV